MKFSRGPILGDNRYSFSGLRAMLSSYNKQTLILCLTFVILLVAHVQVSKAQKTDVNHIFIIDKTGSMAGKGSPAFENIWPKVKVNLFNYIENDLRNGDQLQIYTYAGGVSGPETWQVSKDFKKQAVKQYIKNIELNGKKTCTYNALLQAFQKMKSIQGLVNKVYLVTDGANSNKFCEHTMVEAIEAFDIHKGNSDKFYYVSLGKEVPKTVDTTVAKYPDAESISNPEGSAKLPVTIIPRADSLTFTKENTNLNQGFRILNKEHLPKDFKLSTKKVYVKGLTGTAQDPSIEPEILDPRVKTSLKLEFLNDIPKGKYSGYIEFEPANTKDVSVSLSPSKTDISFVNVPPKVVKVGFPDSREKISLTKGDTSKFQFELGFNRKAVKKNTKVVFPINGNLDNIKLQAAFGRIENGKWKIKPSELIKKKGSLEKYQIFLSVFPEQPFREGKRSLEATLSKKIKANKTIEVKYLKKGKKSWHISNLQLYSPTPLWEQVLWILLGASGLGILIWFVLLRNRVHPPMSGKLQFKGQLGEIRLKGLKGLILHWGKAPEKPKDTKLKTLFVGKTKVINLDSNDESGGDSAYVEIKPVKRNRQTWNILKGYNCNLDPPERYLIHSQRYTIEPVSQEGDPRKEFRYDNIRHQRVE